MVRDRIADVLAGMHDHLADIAAMQNKRAALKVEGRTADGTVKVTVNGRGQWVKTIIEKSYLDDHDFEDLGGYITKAAQAAAGEAAQRVAEMAAPLAERQRNGMLPSFSEILDRRPDFSDLIALGLDEFAVSLSRDEIPSISSVGGIYDDGDRAELSCDEEMS